MEVVMAYFRVLYFTRENYNRHPSGDSNQTIPENNGSDVDIEKKKKKIISSRKLVAFNIC
jgi:hypothetical protein